MPQTPILPPKLPPNEKLGAYFVSQERHAPIDFKFSMEVGIDCCSKQANFGDATKRRRGLVTGHVTKNWPGPRGPVWIDTPEL